MKNKLSLILALVLCIVLCFTGCTAAEVNSDKSPVADIVIESVSDIPEFVSKPYVIINNNIPEFDESDMVTESYEYYSPLDKLGRCGVAMACVGTDIMPTEERGAIGQIKPTGWHLVKYDCVDGKYLYNRCHLIGYQLTGENANRKSLITGTRYLNVEGMLPFENAIDDYVEETENHVIYRVTPIFEGDNLLASGVKLEAKSVEDNGKGICFNVYVYNSQPGIFIDYKTGESHLLAEETTQSEDSSEPTNITYILNKNTKKFHKDECESVKDMKPKNKANTDKSREELINSGYSPCKSCNS